MPDERGFDETEHAGMGRGAASLKDKAIIERSEAIYAWKRARAGQKAGAARAADRKAGKPAPRTPEDRHPYKQMETKTVVIGELLDGGLKSLRAKAWNPLEIRRLLDAETQSRARGAILPPPHPRSLSERAKSSPKAARDSARTSALEGMKKASKGKVSGTAPSAPTTDSNDAIHRMNRQWNRIRAIRPGELPE